MALMSGAARRRSATTGAAAMTCSKLSRTSRSRLSRSQSATVSLMGRVPPSVTPSAVAIRGATSIGSRIGSSGTKKTPSGKSSAARAASWSDSRVLPVPPGPVRVSSRVVASSPAASSSSASRPTKVVSCTGRLLGRASSVRSGGNADRRPSPTTSRMRTGAVRSLSRCSPRSTSRTPSTGWSDSRSRVRLDARIWPPWATAAIRAARLMLSPTRLPPLCSAAPELMPIRTRIGASSGHGSAWTARWPATAASIAVDASGKATKNESPSVPCSTPPYAAHASRRSVRWRSRRSR